MCVPSAVSFLAALETSEEWEDINSDGMTTGCILFKQISHFILQSTHTHYAFPGHLPQL